MPEDIIRIHQEYDCYFSEMDTDTQDKLIKAICEGIEEINLERIKLELKIVKLEIENLSLRKRCLK